MSEAFGDRLTKMAEDLIIEVAEAPIETKIDAFKALSSFFIATTKLGKVAPDDADSGGASLPAMRQRIAAAANGGGK